MKWLLLNSSLESSFVILTYCFEHRLFSVTLPYLGYNQFSFLINHSKLILMWLHFPHQAKSQHQITDKCMIIQTQIDIKTLKVD